MSRYLLDTNIIRNITKPKPSETLMAWMAQQADEDLYCLIADDWGDPQGCARSRNPLDMIIAAVAEANDCVVTDNARDFAGVRIVNPVRGGA